MSADNRCFELEEGLHVPRADRVFRLQGKSGEHEWEETSRSYYTVDQGEGETANTVVNYVLEYPFTKSKTCLGATAAANIT